MEPLFSIVIANYNYGRFLEDAIKSVLYQSCQDFELIVCDAASTDNSVEIIKKYEDKISWWCSEKDNGQSDAFNKGFRHARGKFLTWLNADDVLMPGALKAVAEVIAKNPNSEWFVGSMARLDENLRIIGCYSSHKFSWSRVNFGLLTGCGPSTFFTRRLLESVGWVDETLHYVMDTDLWYRFAIKGGVAYKRTVKLVWGLREHKDSKTSGYWLAKEDPLAKEHRRKFVAERSRALEQYMPKCKALSSLVLYLSASPLDHIRSYFMNRRYVGKCYKIGGML